MTDYEWYPCNASIIFTTVVTLFVTLSSLIRSERLQDESKTNRDEITNTDDELDPVRVRRSQYPLLFSFSSEVVVHRYCLKSTYFSHPSQGSSAKYQRRLTMNKILKRFSSLPILVKTNFISFATIQVCCS